ncbi:YveK family protein [Planococcus beigongshangi]|uniref:YveK family protein n=1 Tax=Planococcus beigongshangi TaxID=2782536 RepID=UPI00193BF947|nr:Wzz/FepE/Etk N-terminal domain-containing protein [Planococcus beigongshangi]
MEKRLDIHGIIGILKKRFKFILFFTFFGAVIAGVISYYVLIPSYETSTQILVNQQTQGTGLTSDAAVRSDLQFINTYNEIIKSRVIMDIVIDQLNLDINARELTSMISVYSSSESQVINIGVQSQDPELAVLIANRVAEVFRNEITGIMNVNNVTILSPAVMEEDPVPVTPPPLLNILVAAIVGFIFGVGVSFLRAYLDTTIKDEQDIEEVLNAPLLAAISPIYEKGHFQQSPEKSWKEKEA